MFYSVVIGGSSFTIPSLIHICLCVGDQPSKLCILLASADNNLHRGRGLPTVIIPFRYIFPRCVWQQIAPENSFLTLTAVPVIWTAGVASCQGTRALSHEISYVPFGGSLIFSPDISQQRENIMFWKRTQFPREMLPQYWARLLMMVWEGALLCGDRGWVFPSLIHICGCAQQRHDCFENELNFLERCCRSIGRDS